MKKTVIISVIVASVLCVIGLTLGAIGLVMVGFDITRLSTASIETNVHDIDEAFDSISIDTQTANVHFALSDNGTCSVVCKEQEKVRHSVEVENGTLTVKAVDSRRWYDRIGIFFFGEESVTVYLPRNEYKGISVDTDTGKVEMPATLSFADAEISSDTGEVEWYASVSGTLRIDTDTGDISAYDLRVGRLELSSDTGRVTASAVSTEETVSADTHTGEITLTDIGCKNLNITSDTGDITLKCVIAADSITAKSDTGEIAFDRSDANNVYAETKTGDIEGSLLTEKIFYADSNTGKVIVPRGEKGGRCELTSKTGSIKITVCNQ